MSKKGFTNGLPRIATEHDCSAPWNGQPNGAHFRCAFCGYKFKVGDYWRWQYTNDTVAWGNPMVCEKCDEGPEKTREKWLRKFEQARSDEWWWFRERTY